VARIAWLVYSAVGEGGRHWGESFGVADHDVGDPKCLA
jgi:hypothetical protein